MANTTIVLGFQGGNQGIPALAKHLMSSSNKNEDNLMILGSGGNYSRITEGVSFKSLPSGVLYGINSIIGPGNIIDPREFNEEIEYIKEQGIDPSKVLCIDPSALCKVQIKIDDFYINKVISFSKLVDKHYMEFVEEISSNCKGQKYMDIFPVLYSYITFLKNNIFSEFLCTNIPAKENYKNVIIEGAASYINDDYWEQFSTAHCMHIAGVPLNSISKVVGIIDDYSNGLCIEELKTLILNNSVEELYLFDVETYLVKMNHIDIFANRLTDKHALQSQRESRLVFLLEKELGIKISLLKNSNKSKIISIA